jgi:hypothetical protein
MKNEGIGFCDTYQFPSNKLPQIRYLLSNKRNGRQKPEIKLPWGHAPFKDPGKNPFLSLLVSGSDMQS